MKLHHHFYFLFFFFFRHWPHVFYFKKKLVLNLLAYYVLVLKFSTFKCQPVAGGVSRISFSIFRAPMPSSQHPTRAAIASFFLQAARQAGRRRSRRGRTACGDTSTLLASKLRAHKAHKLRAGSNKPLHNSFTLHFESTQILHDRMTTRVARPAFRADESIERLQVSTVLSIQP